MTEGIIAACAVLALIVSIVAVVVSFRTATGDSAARLDEFQFSWTPLVALEGSDLTGAGSTRELNFTIHLEGRGFAHNLIVNLFRDDEGAERAKIIVWAFKKAPAMDRTRFVYQVGKPGQGNQNARIEGTFQNVFRQQIHFKQSGRISAATNRLELMSGAPEYTWPWKTIKPV